jgi:hypothetical protein
LVVNGEIAGRTGKEVTMSWEIKVWHEDLGDRSRLSIEAGPEVPDDVISTVAASYWFEEVQHSEDEWEDAEDMDGGQQPTNPRLQG